MASIIAPVLESEIAIEQAPGPIDIGGLFSGFGRAIAPKATSVPSGDREFADAIQGALSIRDNPDLGGPQKARDVVSAAVIRLASFGQVTEEQAAIAGQFGIDVTSFLGIDPEKQARDEFFSGIEGQTYLRMARVQLAEENITNLTEEQVANYAFSLKINNQAISTQLETERARLDLGLIVNSNVVRESIAQDMDIMTAAYMTALQDGIVTEAERATLNMQFQQFAGVKYGAYRDKVPGVSETLNAMQGLVNFLGTQQFDETENTLDQYRIFMKNRDMSPVAIEAFTMAVKKGNLTDLGASLSEMYDAAEALGMLDTAIKFDAFATTEEVDRAAAAAVESTSDFITDINQTDKFMQAYIRGTLQLNNGDINFADVINRRDFFNQSLGMLSIVAAQNEALLGKVERGLLTDPSFEANLVKFLQFEPVNGNTLFERYIEALRSDLTNMDNQISGALGTVFTDVLTINPQTSKFGIDFDRIREIYGDSEIGGASMRVAIDKIEEKVNQIGGIESYLKMSVSNQQIQVGSNGPMFTLSSIIGNDREIKRIFSLSSERAKLSDALERVINRAKSSGVDITAIAQEAIDRVSPKGLAQDERMAPEISVTGLGKIGSEQAPYTFDGMSDDEAYKTFDNMPVGSFFINPADGKLYEIISRAEDGTVFKDVDTGRRFK